MIMNSIGEMLHTLKRRSDVLGLIQYGSAECTDENISGLEMVKSLGADQVIDYTKEDFTKSGQTHDIVFDTVGKISGSRSKGSLKKKGVFVSTKGSASEKTGDSIFLKELIKAGKTKPVIDRRYPLEQTTEAHRYVETGHEKGNVVITVEHNNKT